MLLLIYVGQGVVSHCCQDWYREGGLSYPQHPHAHSSIVYPVAMWMTYWHIYTLRGIITWLYDMDRGHAGYAESRSGAG